jgi:hypothetical protein
MWFWEGVRRISLDPVGERWTTPKCATDSGTGRQVEKDLKL